MPLVIMWHAGKSLENRRKSHGKMEETTVGIGKIIEHPSNNLGQSQASGTGAFTTRSSPFFGRMRSQTTGKRPRECGIIVAYSTLSAFVEAINFGQLWNPGSSAWLRPRQANHTCLCSRGVLAGHRPKSSILSIPSGKQAFCEMENHHVSWVTQLSMDRFQ